jgi:cytochrome c biogenesis factor
MSDQQQHGCMTATLFLFNVLLCCLALITIFSPLLIPVLFLIWLEGVLK